MSAIRLISTDFDGTLIGHPSDGRCTPALAEALKTHHAAGGIWAVNTGRSLHHAVEGVDLLAAPVEPDFLLTNEREIFRRSERGGWEPFGEWNAECYRQHDDLFQRAEALFAAIQEMADRSPEIRLVHEEGRVAGLITATEEVMDMVAADLTRLAFDVPDFGFQRNTVYLRFCHRNYHKGSALSELCRLTGISAGEVFAVGDHFNDLSMLDGSCASWVACPANAIQPVKSVVRRLGGYVAGQPWGEGVAEALSHFWTRASSRPNALARQA